MSRGAKQAVALDRTDTDTEDFDPHDWPFFWVTQVAARYLQRLERGLKRLQLDVSRYRVLMCVGDKTMNVSEIAELAIVKLPTMMKIVQRMEAEGLVKSSPRPSDGRFTDVVLTARGKALRATAGDSARRLYTASFARIAPADEARLAALLEKVFADLGA